MRGSIFVLQGNSQHRGQDKNEQARSRGEVKRALSMILGSIVIEQG